VSASILYRPLPTHAAPRTHARYAASAPQKKKGLKDKSSGVVNQAEATKHRAPDCTGADTTTGEGPSRPAWVAVRWACRMPCGGEGDEGQVYAGMVRCRCSHEVVTAQVLVCLEVRGGSVELTRQSRPGRRPRCRPWRRRRARRSGWSLSLRPLSSCLPSPRPSPPSSSRC
jgi:hypothetical protein